MSSKYYLYYATVNVQPFAGPRLWGFLFFEGGETSRLFKTQLPAAPAFFAPGARGQLRVRTGGLFVVRRIVQS